MKKKLFILLSSFIVSTICWAQDSKLGVTHSSQSNINRGPANIFPVTRILSKEITVSLSGNITIANKFRDYEIRTWNEKKVKIETSLSYDSLKSYTQEDLWKKAKVEIAGDSENLNISANSTDAITIKSQTKIQIDNNGKLTKVPTIAPLKRNLVIYVPSEAKVKIQDEYCNILISDALSTLDANLFNCVLESMDLKTLKLVSKYSNVNIANTGIANITFEQGMLITKNLKNLTANTKTSIIEFGNVDIASIISNNDTYEMQAVKRLTGQKTLGSIRMERLTNAFELRGENVDIRINNIAQDVETIKVTDQYATLYLPINDHKQYTMDFKGQSTTFLSTNAALKRQFSGQSGQNKTNINDKDVSQPKGLNFTYQEGNGSGMRITIGCNHCSVNTK